MKPGLLSSALPRTVVTLGFVSLANDAGSEMLTPLLPIFLTATLVCFFLADYFLRLPLWVRGCVLLAIVAGAAIGG